MLLGCDLLLESLQEGSIGREGKVLEVQWVSLWALLINVLQPVENLFSCMVS